MGYLVKILLYSSVFVCCKFTISQPFKTRFLSSNEAGFIVSRQQADCGHPFCYLTSYIGHLDIFVIMHKKSQKIY